MQVRSRIPLPNKPKPLYSLFNPLLPRIPNFPKSLTLTLEMVTQSGRSRRPICESCSKPTRFCLCTRFKTPKIQNSVAITILQHSLEKRHPLNSTRIAALGLKNVGIISVSDVNFQARFNIRVLDPHLGHTGEERSKSFKKDIKKMGFEKHPDEEAACKIDFDGKLRVNGDFECEQVGAKCSVNDGLRMNFDGHFCGKERLVEENDVELDFESIKSTKGTVSRDKDPEEVAIDLTIEKYGVITSCQNCMIAFEKQQKVNYEKLMDCEEVVDDLAKGFVVKKFQRKQSNGSDEYEECEEYGVIIPQGSVLLFPSEKAVGIDDLDCQVKNLIVLDGTWAKAKRMYSENPWLKALPHLKLDMDKVSLYSEVRHQPRVGYLSTIESIVYSLKAVGDNCEGLDGLLEVFESMVADQRRCKDERMNKAST